MQIYDTHCDVFSNLYERNKKGEKDIFKKYHLDNLHKGQVVGGIWVVYSEYDFDILEAYNIALKEYEPYKNDFDVLYGLEGLRNVKDLETFKKLYDLGVRHAMLTWNEENHLATGVAGSSNRGLTNEGKKFLDFMETSNMIVDVSHLNIKSFYDVLDYVKKPVIASHSCAYSISDHRRNLNDEQLQVLKNKGGYVGMNSAKNFVSKDPSKQNVKGFANQLEYLIDKLDINHIMLGLDMMDFLSDYDDANLMDLRTHADSQNIINELRNRGFKEEDIKKIAYLNYLDMRKELVGY